MPERRRSGDQSIGKCRDGQPIKPQQAHVAQRRRDLPGDLQFRRAAQTHAWRAVNEQMHVAIDVTLKELDVQLIALGTERPVDGVKIIARRVIAMAGNFRSAAGQFLSDLPPTAGCRRFARKQATAG